MPKVFSVSIEEKVYLVLSTKHVFVFNNLQNTFSNDSQKTIVIKKEETVIVERDTYSRHSDLWEHKKVLSKNISNKMKILYIMARYDIRCSKVAKHEASKMMVKLEHNKKMLTCDDDSFRDGIYTMKFIVIGKGY